MRLVSDLNPIAAVLIPPPPDCITRPPVPDGDVGCGAGAVLRPDRVHISRWYLLGRRVLGGRSSSSTGLLASPESDEHRSTSNPQPVFGGWPLRDRRRRASDGRRDLRSDRTAPRAEGGAPTSVARRTAIPPVAGEVIVTDSPPCWRRTGSRGRTVMAFDTFMVYVGVYTDVDGAEADYDLIKDLHPGRTDRRVRRCGDPAARGQQGQIVRKHETPTRVSGGRPGDRGQSASRPMATGRNEPDITPPTSRPTNQDHLTLPQPQSPTFPLRHLG